MPLAAVGNVVIPFLRGHGLKETPNLRAPRGEQKLSSYDECIVVSCSALRRFNPDMGIKLATDIPVEGVLHDLLDDLDVDCSVIPFTRAVPQGFADSFFATLYYLDVVAGLPAEGVLLLDPDVLCTRSLSGFCGPSSDRVMVLPISYPEDFQINGLSRGQAGRIHTDLDGSTGLPGHFGGEFYYIPGSLVPQVSERLENAWCDALQRFGRGSPHFVTEEHFLSYALRPFDACGSGYDIKRIWTTLRQRNVSGDEGRYVLWHLPSEKGRGFHAMYEDAIDRDSWFWTSTDEDFVQRSGVFMGLHHRKPMRFAMETLIGSFYGAVDKIRGIERLP